MKAIMLAAGVGRRLYGDDDNQPPKVLIELGGKSLLARHLENLKAIGVDELTLVVGYRRDEIVREAMTAAGNIGMADFIQPVVNERFRSGSVISLWTARKTLCSGDDILFMDADVLYHPLLLERLRAAPAGNCLLLDRDLEEGDEPVRLCVRDGRPVDFGKMIEGDFDLGGEWPGFMRLSPEGAGKIAAAAAAFMNEARLDAPYEDAIRRVMVEEAPGAFTYADITGIPWIEIDFPGDLERAEKEILPKLQADLKRGRII